MTDIQLTEEQKSAARSIEDWWKNADKKERPIYRLFGFAGCGKSTILKHVLGDIGLSIGGAPKREDIECGAIVPDVLAATFTGKAASVLRKKGTPASTIHSLIYSVSEATEEMVAEAMKELKALQTQEGLAESSSDAYSIRLLIQDKFAKIKEMKKPHFGLNIDSAVRDCQLIVLDEVSMVDQVLAGDLLSFGKPILVLGDPGQLPPIKGEGYFTQAKPDTMLEQIHRQAADSPIIQLATKARQGKWIDFGRYSDDVWKMHQREVDLAMMASADQVVCGKNATRLMLNNALRGYAGIEGELPTPDDKIICTKNENDVGLINGQFVTLSDIEREREIVFSARLTDDEGNPIGAVRRNGKSERFPVYMGHFLDHIQFDPDRADRDWKIKKGLTECTYGYAITCHKAQGSGWPVVAVWDDALGGTKQQRNQWLYTAITRAERGLLICE